MVAAADLIPHLYRFLKKRQPDCLWEGDRNSTRIALTFDDGPHPTHTPALLDVLAQHQVKASFFWLGACVERYPEIARTVYEQGHWIGLHSYGHRPFWPHTTPQIKDGLAKTQAAIAQACKIDPKKVIDVRPPYGICTNHTLKQLTQWGYRPVMWSVVPIDWTEPGVSIVSQRMLNQTTGGDILVLHDGCSGGAAVSQVAATILPQLLQTGFNFITIHQMWNESKSTSAPNHLI